MKFGGTSVANVERIRNVARHVKREVDAGSSGRGRLGHGGRHQSAGRLGARGLRRAARRAREYDAVVATGEQVTAGVARHRGPRPARHLRALLQGWQIPIITDNADGVAWIKDIPGDKILSRLEQGEVAVITGFQGIEPERNRVSTLGPLAAPTPTRWPSPSP